MRILIVEDDADFRTLMIEHMNSLSYTAESAENGAKAIQLLENKDFSIVLLDLLLPDTNGMDILRWIKENAPLTEVIVITGHGTIRTAVEAIKLGAYDFITKPCSLSEVEIAVKKAYESRTIKRENLLLKREKDVKQDYEGYVFESTKMKEIIKNIERIACTNCPVLITGESGVGKEVIATIVHRESDRASKPMVTLNVPSIPKELVEAELFGYEKGSFTGADKSKAGFFELADGGTLFLDEIGEMDKSIQVKLLRVIENGRFYRVGGRKEIESDVRIIAATNRNIQELIEKDVFREDLYYRLNVVEIFVPPLRERPDDILPLAHYFLNNFNRKYLKNIKGFGKDSYDLLLSYSWPGNVRELKNVIERAVLFSDSEFISREELSCLLNKKPNRSGSLAMRDVEKEHIIDVLKRVNNNKKRASEILGIPLRTLYRKLETYGLK